MFSQERFKEYLEKTLRLEISSKGSFRSNKKRSWSPENRLVSFIKEVLEEYLSVLGVMMTFDEQDKVANEVANLFAEENAKPEEKHNATAIELFNRHEFALTPSGEEYCVIKETSFISEFSAEYFKKLIKPDLVASKRSEARTLDIIYDNSMDYVERTTELVRAQSVIGYANYYAPPKWRTLEDPKKGLQSEVDAFFRHLIPCDEDREYLFCWIKWMLFERAKTFLIMTSETQGTGKGTLADILFALCGDRNWIRGGAGFLTSNFRGQIKGKQLVFLDEFRFRKNRFDEKETLKTLVENTIAVETKNVTEETLHNISSYMICNNSYTNIWIEPSDRRFSCVAPTEVPLLDAWSFDKVANFKKMIETDVDLQAEIGWFFYNYEIPEKYTPEKPYNKLRFEEHVIKSAIPAYRTIIQRHIFDEDRPAVAFEDTYRDLKDEFTKEETGVRKRDTKFPNVEYFVNFFSKVTYKGEKLFNVERSPMGQDATIQRRKMWD